MQAVASAGKHHAAGEKFGRKRIQYKSGDKLACFIPRGERNFPFLQKGANWYIDVREATQNGVYFKVQL